MLQFSNTTTIGDFKVRNHADTLDVIKNPQTGKLFFVCGSTTGKVTQDDITRPVVSECVDTETGETFFMLHNQSSNNVVATF